MDTDDTLPRPQPEAEPEEDESCCPADGEPGAEPPPGADETFWPEWKRVERAQQEQRRRDDAEAEAWVQGQRSSVTFGHLRSQIDIR